MSRQSGRLPPGMRDREDLDDLIEQVRAASGDHEVVELDESGDSVLSKRSDRQQKVTAEQDAVNLEEVDPDIADAVDEMFGLKDPEPEPPALPSGGASMKARAKEPTSPGVPGELPPIKGPRVSARHDAPTPTKPPPIVASSEKASGGNELTPEFFKDKRATNPTPAAAVPVAPTRSGMGAAPASPSIDMPSGLGIDGTDGPVAPEVHVPPPSAAIGSVSLGDELSGLGSGSHPVAPGGRAGPGFQSGGFGAVPDGSPMSPNVDVVGPPLGGGPAGDHSQSGSYAAPSVRSRFRQSGSFEKLDGAALELDLDRVKSTGSRRAVREIDKAIDDLEDTGGRKNKKSKPGAFVTGIADRTVPPSGSRPSTTKSPSDGPGPGIWLAGLALVLIIGTLAFGATKGWFSEPPTEITDFSSWLEGAEAYDAAIANQRDTHEPVLVYFRETVCSECDELEGAILRASAVDERIAEFMRIEIDPAEDSESSRITTRHGISGFPALVFMQSGEPSAQRVNFRVQRGAELYLQTPGEFLLTVDELLAAQD